MRGAGTINSSQWHALFIPIRQGIYAFFDDRISAFRGYERRLQFDTIRTIRKAGKKVTCLPLLIICLTIILPLDAIPRESSAVTYTLSGGRLGDNVVCYLHALWVAHKTGLPLLYKPFAKAAQFSFHANEIHSYEHYQSHFRNKKKCSRSFNLQQIDPHFILYDIPYFSEFAHEQHALKKRPFFKVVWNEPSFKEKVRKALKPTLAFEPDPLPTETLNVAVHIRTGGSFDPDYTIELTPYKFPPYAFFTEQLNRIASLFPNKTILAHVFTDDNNPESVVHTLEKQVQAPSIIYRYRRHGNHHNSNVMEDLLTMSRFPIMIRALSNYSFMAQLLGNFDLILEPYLLEYDASGVYTTKTTMLVSHRFLEQTRLSYPTLYNADFPRHYHPVPFSPVDIRLLD